jgi:ribulose-phosphate 3-epimerase
MKAKIAPSVLSFPLPSLRPVVEEMAAGGADVIHFDVMDGQFVPPITFGAQFVKALRDVGEIRFEAHLMTQTPERHFEAFASAGCSRIIFHQEATAHGHRLAQTLRHMGLESAVAINPGTAVETVFPLLDVVDAVLVMTVNPGWGGQHFIETALEKVHALRRRKPDLDIEVDGGIDPETIRRAWDAGADLFVVGTYLQRAPSIAEGIRLVRERCG